MHALTRVTLILILVAQATGCGTSALPQPTGPFSRLIVFGDSLSDTGNLLAASNFVPGPPYFNGRFTNGDNWVDHLAKRYGLDAKPSLQGGGNYAMGAAATGLGLSGYGGFALGPNIREQVKLYRGVPNGTELFAFWAGAIDVFEVLSDDCTITPDQMADNIALAIIELHGRGGRQFLVLNLPDFGRIPRFRESPREARATELTLAFNAALAARLDSLKTLDAIVIYRLDVAARFAEALAVPPEGIANVTDPAWSGNVGSSNGETTPNPDAHLFWDSVHPGRIGHLFIADAAIAAIEQKLVQPTPLPGTPQAPFNIPWLDFWGTYLSFLFQPSANAEECRY